MPDLTAMIEEIRALVDHFLVESMTDADLLAQSDAFRAGYAQGFREATAAAVGKMLKDKLNRSPSGASSATVSWGDTREKS